MKLQDLTELQMGYSFRGRVDFSGEEGIPVIQMKDFDKAGALDTSKLYRVDIPFKGNHYTQSGDLVFRARGGKPTTSIIKKGAEQMVIAAPLVRIRVSDARELIPEYLLWYLHQREAQSFFHARSEGTVLQMISVATLASLPIQLPTLEKQREIIELSKLIEKEKSLMEDLVEKRQKLMNKHLRQLAFNNP